VDVQVLDRANRFVEFLTAADFTLREEGRVLPIRNFACEDVPLDVLFLVDVSRSMRPHVEALAQASRDALNVLGEDDRVAIMVFDRATRLKLPFDESIEAVEQAFNELLRKERFLGGTDITRALYDAARYVAQNARREARRAIVILTDDQTERERDEAGVLRELARSDTVVSALLTPDATGYSSYPGGTWPAPRSRRGGILDDIIFGRRIPPVVSSRTRSAGTAEIARESGGDSLPVDDARALETTLARIRQRYALHFLVPPGARPGEERTIAVNLAPAALRRYPGAEVLYRHTYYAPAEGGAPAPGAETTVSSGPRAVEPQPGAAARPAPAATSSTIPDAGTTEEAPSLKRRRAVDGSGGATGPNPAATSPQSSRGGWRRVTDPEPPPPEEPKPEPPPKKKR
jgi:VWFA-related protein